MFYEFRPQLQILEGFDGMAYRGQEMGAWEVCENKNGELSEADLCCH
jgi:hypothetical protein